MSTSPKTSSPKLLTPLILVSRTAAAVLLLAATTVQAHWPNTNLTKWVQYPDRKGYDVLAAQPPTGSQPLILADDFLCRKTGPITDIHIWTSWLGDNPNTTIPITLSIWTDVPASPTNYSRRAPATQRGWYRANTSARRRQAAAKLL